MNRTRTSGLALGLTTALAVSLLPALVQPAAAHPDDKHGPKSGHIPAKIEKVRLVGQTNVADRSPHTAPPEGLGALEGRIADVNVFGNYAYLAAFREPDCEDGGVYVVDITDPTKPVEVRDAFIPTSPGSYVGEGVQVIRIGARDVLLFNNEVCGEGGKGGMTLVDVTNPRSPSVLAAHVGDTTGDGDDDNAVTDVHSIHSVFGWVDGSRAFAVLVDNDEAKDIDIMEITNPAAPVMLSETSFVDDARVVQANPPNGDSQFLHDAVVKEIAGRQTMLASYWDNGYIKLDVEDPANPVFLDDTDFAATEPFAAQLGLPQGFEPEGNAHQAEFSADNQFFLGTDEDFNPFRVLARITSGPNSGSEATASNGSGTPAVTNTNRLSGSTDFVGRGCVDSDPRTEGDQTDPYPAKSGDIAIIERGACSFQQKYDRAVAAGYTGVIVFGLAGAGCEGLISPLVSGETVPFVFVPRSSGLGMLNQTVGSDPCAQTSPAIGGETADVSIDGVFDGWGYVHLFDAQTMADLDQYAIAESLDPKHAVGSGDLSVHEVAVDPKNPNRAYLSYYAGGFRVIEFDRNGIREVGAYVDPEGSNLWGVEFWTSPTTGQDYVLASDRDFGLQIFQYDPAAPTVTASISPDPVPAGTGSVTVSGTLSSSTSATATVSIRDEDGNSTDAQSTTVAPGGDGAYSVTVDVSDLEPGTITATVTATDAAGKTGLATDTATKASAAPSPSPSSPSPSTPPTPMPPTPLPQCTGTTTTLDQATIIATGAGGVTVRSAPSSTVELYAYTQPSTTFTRVRTATTDADGLARFTVRPPANTRLYAQRPGCQPDVARDSVVLNVRTALSLFVERNGPRDYTFSGDSLPARPGGLIISLYRVTDTGRQVLTAQTRADAQDGEWTLNRTFTGTGRFGFVVRTGQDLQNAPGTSNVRSLLIF
jgi:hypothetical protein